MRSRRVLSDVATVMHCAPTYQFCAFTMHTVIFPRTQQTIQIGCKIGNETRHRIIPYGELTIILCIRVESFVYD